MITEQPKNNSTSNPSNISNTSNPSNISNISIDRDQQIKWILSKDKPKIAQIKCGIHSLSDDVFYFGIETFTGQTAVITSEKKIYVDFKKKTSQGWEGSNEIKENFGLNYRYPLETDVLDSVWSVEGIKKFLYSNHEPTLKTVFEKICSINKEYIFHVDDRSHELVALDIMSGYFLPCFDTLGRTSFIAPSNSGKTQQCRIYKLLSFNPMMSPDISGASFYRAMESTCGTLIIDDFDIVPDERKQELLQHWRTGYKNSSKAIRVGDRTNRKLDAYRNYGHVIMNGTLPLDAISRNRSKGIPMTKTTNELTRKVIDENSPKWRVLRDDMHICALQNWSTVRECYRNLKFKLTARDLEVSRGLLSIAYLISEELFDSMQNYLLEILEQQNQEAEDDWTGIMLRFWSDKETGVEYSAQDIAKEILRETGQANVADYDSKLRGISIWVGKHLLLYSSLFKWRITHKTKKKYYLKDAEAFKTFLADKYGGIGGIGYIGGIGGRYASVLEKFKTLWKDKTHYSGKPIPIDTVKSFIPEFDEEFLSHALNKGDIMQHKDGWVLPL